MEIFNNICMVGVVGFTAFNLIQSPIINQSFNSISNNSSTISNIDTPQEIKSALREAGINDNNFEWAIKHILKVEGGWSNHPNDRGGKTKYGIIENVARRHNLSVESLKLSDALKIYYSDYWLASGADKAPSPLNLAIMNSYVNSGRKWSVNGSNPLEQALNYIKQQDDYYIRIYSSNSSQLSFKNGWHRRTKYMIEAVRGGNPSW